jgi:hypothetical protein
VLKLLCDQGKMHGLDALLVQVLGLSAGQPGCLVENDAVDGDGNPVLFGYSCDMPRIARFANALQFQGRKGMLACFDFQAEVFSRCFGERIGLHTISFDKFERRFFT